LGEGNGPHLSAEMRYGSDFLTVIVHLLRTSPDESHLPASCSA
jgi:hypothetical protein